jgi:hypothetical protein
MLFHEMPKHYSPGFVTLRSLHSLMHTSIILLLTTLSNIFMLWQGSKRNKRNDSSMLFHVSRKKSGMLATVLVCQKHCTTTLEYLI